MDIRSFFSVLNRPEWLLATVTLTVIPAMFFIARSLPYDNKAQAMPANGMSLERAQEVVNNQRK